MVKLIDKLRLYHSEGLDCVSRDLILNNPLQYAQKVELERLAEDTIHDGLFIPGNSIAIDCIDIIKGCKKSLYHGFFDVEGEGVAVVIIMDNHWSTHGTDDKLVQVYVKPKYRRKGLGTYLLKCANLYAKKNKIKIVAKPFDEKGTSAFKKIKGLSIKLVK